MKKNIQKVFRSTFSSNELEFMCTFFFSKKKNDNWCKEINAKHIKFLLLKRIIENIFVSLL